MNTTNLIEDSRIPELFMSNGQRAMTGTMVFSQKNVRKEVLFKDGAMIWARTNNPDEYFGQYLLSRGLISVKEFETCSKQLTPEKKLGMLLIECGAISHRDLSSHLLGQTIEIALDLFDWTEGEFELTSDPPVLDPKTYTPVDWRTLVLLGIKRIKCWSTILKGVENLRQVPFCTVVEFRADQLPLDYNDQVVMRIFKSPTTIDNVMGTGKISDFDLFRSFRGLSLIGALAVVDERQSGVFCEIEEMIQSPAPPVQQPVQQPAQQQVQPAKQQPVQQAGQQQLQPEPQAEEKLEQQAEQKPEQQTDQQRDNQSDQQAYQQPEKQPEHKPRNLGQELTNSEETSEWFFPEVLQKIHGSKWTGTLQIEVDKNPCWFSFNNGEITSTAAGYLEEGRPEKTAATSQNILDNVWKATASAKGRAWFRPQSNGTMPLASPSVNTRELILNSLDWIPDQDSIVKVVKKTLGRTTPSQVSSALANVSNLDASEGYLLYLVDGKTTGEELFLLSHLTEQDTSRILYKLLVEGFIESRRHEAPPPVRQESRPVQQESPPVQQEPPPVRQESHPVQQESPPVQQEPLLVQQEPLPDEKEPSPVQIAENKPSSGGSAPKVTTTSKPTRSREEILNFAASIDILADWEILGVSQDADKEERRHAFLKLLKTYHPDIIQSSEVREACERITSNLIRAHKRLCDDINDPSNPDLTKSKKEDTDQGKVSVADPEAFGAPNMKVEAESLYQRGETFLAKGNFHSAIEYYKKAVRLLPANASYRYALGQALAKNPRWRKKAEEELSEAIRLSPLESEYYLALGKLNKAGGRPSFALKMFRKVLALDPNNTEARAELQDIGKNSKSRKLPA